MTRTKTDAKNMIEYRASALAALPDKIPSRGGRVIDGRLWKCSGINAVDKLVELLPLFDPRGHRSFDFFDDKFEELLVEFYNAEADRRIALEAENCACGAGLPAVPMIGLHGTFDPRM